MSQTVDEKVHHLCLKAGLLISPKDTLWHTLAKRFRLLFWVLQISVIIYESTFWRYTVLAISGH